MKEQFRLPDPRTKTEDSECVMPVVNKWKKS
jgi:hypothetical protein